MNAPRPPPASGPSLPNPWWIPPFLGRVPPGVDRRHLSLLGAVAAALMFEEYDLALITSVLPFIAEHFGVLESSLPIYLGVVRLGALPAVVLIASGDQMGRRRAFLASVLASALATVATGFAWSIESFVFFQMVVRMTFVVGVSVAYVLIAEEFPAERRGWGMGALAALGALGYGVEAGLFSQIEHLPYGWRSLYWAGALPLLFMGVLARTIPETSRFSAHAATRAGPSLALWRQAIDPIRRLAAENAGRSSGVSICMAAIGFAGVAAFQFTSYYTIGTLGWSPGQYAAMFVVGGAVGIVGNIVAGTLGDRVGRRRVGALCLSGFPLFVALFYWGPGWAVPLAWVGFVFTSSGGRMILRAFSTELFPTDRRATASGWVMIVEVVSSAAGLLALSIFTQVEGDLARFIPVLSLATLAAAAVLLRFPETRSRELESI